MALRESCPIFSTFKEIQMKKLLIAATFAAAAFGATSLMADPGHQHRARQAGTAAGCPMAEQGQGAERSASGGERHAQMQKRMQAMHASMGSHEGRGRDRGAQEEHQH